MRRYFTLVQRQPALLVVSAAVSGRGSQATGASKLVQQTLTNSVARHLSLVRSRVAHF